MHTTGTALGHIDLLEKVRDYLVNTVGWTELAYTGYSSPVADDDVVNLSLRAPGASAGNEYFLNIETGANLANGAYGWKMSAAQDWESGLSDLSQLGSSPSTYFNTWQNTIDYWLYANTRRFILIAKCNTSYISMYAGLFLPFALPNEYLRPFFLCGNSNVLAPYNEDNSRNQFIANPGYGACYALGYDADAWRAIKNSDAGSGDMTTNGALDGVIWPHRSLRQYGSANQEADQSGSWNHGGFFYMRPNANGESPQFLCHIMCNTDHHMLGALEGVYSTAGFGKTSEQVASFDSVNYRLFQNIFRTTPRDFMSIEEA